MHREILGLSDGEQGDHIDGNGLNNQRHNLRRCTNAENVRNRGTQVNNTSGYKGVSFHKNANRWRATIKHNRKTIHIGYFDSAMDAALAYDNAAKNFHGDFARLNFEQEVGDVW